MRRSLLLVLGSLCGAPPLLAAPPAVARVPLPAGVKSIAVDGVTLPVELAELERNAHPALYVPRGRHLIRLGTDGAERAYLSAKWYAVGYRARRDALAERELIEKVARAFDHPEDAELLHLLGLRHHVAGDGAAAARLYRRALATNPAYAPSHLDLALVLLAGGDKPGGLRELLLARAFNPGDVFGLETLVETLAARHQLTLGAGKVVLRAADYLPADTTRLSEVDRRFVRFYNGIARYLDSREEQAKCLSNLGLYFARKNEATAARRWYGEALRALARAGRSRTTLQAAAVIYRNIARTLGQAREAADYQAMARICEAER